MLTNFANLNDEIKILDYTSLFPCYDWIKSHELNTYIREGQEVGQCQIDIRYQGIQG